MKFRKRIPSHTPNIDMYDATAAYTFAPSICRMPNAMSDLSHQINPVRPISSSRQSFLGLSWTGILTFKVNLLVTRPAG